MDKSISHLNFFIQLIPKTLEYYQHKEIDNVQQFSLGLLRRLLNASLSLKLILKNINEISELEFTAGITTRTIILDMLLGLNIYKLLKDNLSKGLTYNELNELTLKFCNEILADGLDKTAKDLNLAKTKGFFDDKRLKEAYNNVAKNHKQFLKPHSGDGAIPKTKYGRGMGAEVLFKKLLNGDSEMKEIAGIYNLYLFYSKYDHFGILYFETLKFTNEEKLNRLDKSISLFVNHCSNLFDILERASKKDKFIESQYKIAADYLLNKNSV